MATSSVRGVQLSWSDWGTGPTVVYAHGLSSSRAAERVGPFDWSPVVATGHRLVAYDARGHGLSSGDADPVHYRWSELALDLRALVDEISPTTPVSGIGCSMGSATILHAAVRAPERFDRLVLMAAPTAWSTRTESAQRYRAAADLAEERGVPALLELLEFVAHPAVLGGDPDFPPPPDIPDALLPSVWRGAADSDLPPASAIAALDLPVLLLAWAGDTGHPVSTGELLQALIPGADLVVAETPADVREWGELIAHFLKR